MTALLGGKYVLDRRLGGGGMAEVFLGHAIGAEGFRRQVAIKQVLPGYAQSSQFAEMFISEARLSSQLQHSNIVAILDFARDQDSGLFLVMEYVDGANLDTLLKTGPLPIPAAVHVVTEVLRGLEYAHTTVMPDGVRGVVHRDVSPHNVLVSHDGGVKIADFGIAKALITSNVTGSEMIKGKPAYMSPEQANGEPLDGRSDLFAVGVMLWEMLCGRPLFLGSSIQETLSRLLFAPMLSPRQLRPELPADLEHVTMRLLARDLSQRYQSATAAMVDLIACRDHPRSGRELLRGLMKTRLGDGATPGEIASGARTALDVRRPLPTPSDGRTPPTQNERPSRRPLVLLLVAVGIMGAAVGLFVASRVNPPVRVVAHNVPVDASPVPTIVARGNPDAPPSSGASHGDGGVDALADPAKEASPPARVTKLQPREQGATERDEAPISQPRTSPDPPRLSELDQDLDKIAKMGIFLDFKGFGAKDIGSSAADVDAAAVIKFWIGKASLFQRCYRGALQQIRRNSDEITWWHGVASFVYAVDSQGATKMRSAGFIHYLSDCLDSELVAIKNMPKPASGKSEVFLDVYIATCIAIWNDDDKAGAQRRRCPATFSSFLDKK